MVGVLPLKRIVLNAVFATLAVAVGAIIGWAFSLGTIGQDPSLSDSTLEDRLRHHGQINRERIKGRMEEFNSIAVGAAFDSVLSGEPAEQKIADMIQTEWNTKCDTIEVYQYQFFASKPSLDTPATLRIDGSSGESIVDELYDYSDGPFGFIAYSASGTVANKLKRFSLDFADHTGSICLVKMEQPSIASAVKQAEERNCSGVLLYASEMFYDSEDPIALNTYFNGAANYGQGDPSRLSFKREEMNLPQIPILPITLTRANELNQNCVIANDQCTVTMSVRMEERIAITQDLIGYIYGYVSPDKYIMIGAAHDSLGPGAAKVGLGYAMLNEVMDLFNALVQDEGWRPRRTIVFGSFGGTQYGNIASSEWVLQNRRKVEGRIIAYISLDELITTADGASTFAARGAPLMKKIVTTLASEISECDGCPTLLDTWEKYYPANEIFSHGRSGGAHEPIYLMSGIPYIQMSHSAPERRFQVTANSYRDTLDNFNTRVDPNLDKTVDMLKVITSTVRILSENAIADYDVVHQANVIDEQLQLIRAEYGQILLENEKYNNLLRVTKNLKTSTSQYESYTNNMDRANEANVRFVNSVAYDFEKCFISDYDIQFPGQTKHSLHRHIVYSPIDNEVMPFPRLRTLLAQNASKDEIDAEIGVIYWHVFQATQALLSSLWQTLQRQL